jgi:exodeoxyribonuclease-3
LTAPGSGGGGDPDELIYTFWKYFRNAFACNAGLRIDHLLLSPSIAGRLVAAEVDRDARGPERTSAHPIGG